MSKEKKKFNEIKIEDELMNVQILSNIMAETMSDWEMDRGIKVTMHIERTDKRVTVVEEKGQPKCVECEEDF